MRRMVSAGRGDVLAIRTVGDSRHRLEMVHACHFSARRHVPNPGGTVGRGGGQIATIRTEGKAGHAIHVAAKRRLVVREALQLAATGHLPQASGAILPGSSEQPSIGTEAYGVEQIRMW